MKLNFGELCITLPVYIPVFTKKEEQISDKKKKIKNDFLFDLYAHYNALSGYCLEKPGMYEITGEIHPLRHV